MMDETWKTSAAPEPSTPGGLGERPGERETPESPSVPTPAPSTMAAAKETDPFAQVGSQIADLMRRFVEQIGSQVAADAQRMTQEAIKLRADAEAEADRIIDAARAEANRIHEEARTRAAAAERLVRGVVGDVGRAQESLAEAIDRFAADVNEPSGSEDIAVISDTPGRAPAQP